MVWDIINSFLVSVCKDGRLLNCSIKEEFLLRLVNFKIRCTFGVFCSEIRVVQLKLKMRC